MSSATIIFCDFVSFSQNDDELGADLVRRLSAKITRELFHRFYDPSVIFLPTGDGIAIALLERDALTPRSGKVEVFQLVNALMRLAVSNQSSGGIGGLRIGVHRGPVVLIRDINRQLNICGFAVNYCQRVMDAAHPNQVLLSEEAFKSLVGDCHEYRGEPFSSDSRISFSGPINVPAKHGLMLHVRVMYRPGEAGWEQAAPFPRGAITSKTERTKFIVDRLRELLEQPKRPLAIYEQSAFSTFGITERTEWAGNSPNDRELLLEQRRLLAELAAQKRTQLYLLIRPIRAYNVQWRKARMDALLGWVRSVMARSNVRLAVTDNYEGPNRLIVQGLFCIEGYKIHEVTGYEVSFVTTSENEVNEAITAFHRVFSQHGQSKAVVLRELEKRRKALIEPENQSGGKKPRRVQTRSKNGN